MGLPAQRWLSGFLISKPPKSPSLGWHQDGWYWDEAVAYASSPMQIFVMFYLTDTSTENGCLRVLPGTHLRPHPLHAQLGRAHSSEVRSDTREWQDAPEHSA